MTATRVQSFALWGMAGRPIAIASQITADRRWSFGAGVAANHAKEATVRLRSALLTINHDVQGCRVDVTGDGRLIPHHDLAIAAGLMHDVVWPDFDLNNTLVAGELGLDGSVRGVSGVTQATLVAIALGMNILVPHANAREAFEVADGRIGVMAIHHLRNLCRLAPHQSPWVDASWFLSRARERASQVVDFAEVRGQEAAVRAITDAVAAGRSIALEGPPGVGKTMIARRVPALLPDMTASEQLEVTRAYSANGLATGLIQDRPFRAPHHTVSVGALVSAPDKRPGELQLATHGVLFLDELPEFSRGTIEALAHALDAMPVGQRPLILTAITPCPCGWWGSEARACACPESAVARHASHVAWALGKLDVRERVAVRPATLETLRSSEPGTSTPAISPAS